MDATCKITYSDNTTAGAGSERSARLAAEQLGGLLFDTPEFQAYNRCLHTVNCDPDIIQLTYQIRDQENNYCCTEEDLPDIDELYGRLEANPKMVALRQSEAALRQLLKQVEAEISAAAQSPFALYARAGCG